MLILVILNLVGLISCLGIDDDAHLSVSNAVNAPSGMIESPVLASRVVPSDLDAAFSQFRHVNVTDLKHGPLSDDDLAALRLEFPIEHRYSMTDKELQHFWASEPSMKDILKQLGDVVTFRDRNPRRSYKIDHEIGSGSRTRVYKCRRPADGKWFAIKGIPLDRYENVCYAICEIELYTKFLPKSHMIIDYIESYTFDNACWIVFELIQGRTYSQIKAPYTNKEALLSMVFHQLVWQQRLLALGVCHYDFSESNIMIDKNGRLKVIDFGMGRQLDEAGRSKGFRYITPQRCKEKDAEKLLKLITRTIDRLHYKGLDYLVALANQLVHGVITIEQFLEHTCFKGLKFNGKIPIKMPEAMESWSYSTTPEANLSSSTSYLVPKDVNEG